MRLEDSIAKTVKRRKERVNRMRAERVRLQREIAELDWMIRDEEELIQILERR